MGIWLYGRLRSCPFPDRGTGRLGAKVDTREMGSSPSRSSSTPKSSQKTRSPVRGTLHCRGSLGCTFDHLCVRHPHLGNPPENLVERDQIRCGVPIGTPEECGALVRVLTSVVTYSSPEGYRNLNDGPPEETSTKTSTSSRRRCPESDPNRDKA